MFRLFFGGKKSTFKPVKAHAPGSKRELFSNITMKTLGCGDLISAVKLPDGEDLNEWLASNAVDFYNELSLIWGIICDVGSNEPNQPGCGFPPGFEYRWAENRTRSPIICSGPEYVDFVMSWVEGEINNEKLFPTSSATPFPKNFLNCIKVIFTRLFRIFAIVYSHHFSKLEEMGAVSHLNTSFKHFMFFVWEYDLIQPNELDALRDIIAELRLRYCNKES
eukprot:gene15088-20301_t